MTKQATIALELPEAVDTGGLPQTIALEGRDAAILFGVLQELLSVRPLTKAEKIHEGSGEPSISPKPGVKLWAKVSGSVMPSFAIFNTVGDEGPSYTARLKTLDQHGYRNSILLFFSKEPDGARLVKLCEDIVAARGVEAYGELTLDPDIKTLYADWIKPLQPDDQEEGSP